MGSRITTNLLTLLITLAVIAGLMGAALASTVFNADKVKQAARQSGAYNSVAPSLLRSYKDVTVVGISGNDPAVQAAAEQTFTPDYVARKIDPAIDNSFAWLGGKQANPNFVIDYSDGKAAFYRHIAANLADRAAALPPCGLSELLAIGTTVKSVDSIDSLNLTNLNCLPPNLEKASIAQFIERYLNRAGTSEALQNTRYAAADITLDGTPFYKHASLRELPSLYRASHTIPWVALMVAILAGLLLFKQAGRQRAGVRLGIILIVSGLACGLLAASLRPLAQRLTGSANLGMPANDMIISLAGMAGAWLRMAAVIAALAGALVLVLIQVRRRSRPDTKIPG